MADNVPVTPGYGASIATDDIGGVQYQRVKVTFGVDGSATDASAANPLPVSATSLPLPTGAALDATLTGGTQRSKLTDGTNNVGVAASTAGASETAVDRLKVNAALRLLDTGQVAGSQLVAAKGDQTTGLWVNVKNASLAVTGAFYQATQPVSGTVTINAIPTGSNVIGAVTQSGTWNIGSITTLPALVAGSAVIGKVSIDQTTPGTTNLVALPANQTINNAQINGVTPLMGNGVTGTGSQRVTIASDNTAFSVNATLQTGSNTIGALTANQSVNNAQIAGAATAVNNGTASAGCQRVTIASDNTAFAVNSNLQAGSNLVGKVGIDQTTPGTTNAVNSTPATPTAFTLSSAATTNLTSVKGSAGTLYTIVATNVGAAVAFLKIYNKASAPAPASDTPILVISVPANGVPVSVNMGTLGHRCATGIAIGITNLIAYTDTTAVAAGQVQALLSYV